MLAGLARDGRGTGLGGKVVSGHEAGTVVAHLGEELSGADAPAAEQRRDGLAVGVRVDRTLDGGAQRRELCDQRPEHGDELGGGAPAGVGVPRQEPGHALLAEPARRPRRRVVVEELERDRRADVGELRGGAWPELLEQTLRGGPLGRGRRALARARLRRRCRHERGGAAVSANANAKHANTRADGHR